MLVGKKVTLLIGIDFQMTFIAKAHLNHRKSRTVKVKEKDLFEPAIDKKEREKDEEKT